MIDLQETRKNIDAIDKQIVDLFEKRMKQTSEVAKYKIATGKAVLDPKREEEKLDALGKLSSSDFNKKGIQELFSQIMSISRKYQYSIMPDEDKLYGFSKVEKLPYDENTKIAFYGTNGTHTQQAMEEIFADFAKDKELQSFACDTFEGVMQAVDEGKAEYGVLPIENSTTGSIAGIYDLLSRYNHAIVAEHIMKINQCLMVLPGVTIDELDTCFSHPQGLMQCSGFLKAHKNLKPVEFMSTAECAKKVAEDGKRNQGAIASRRAAVEYGLEIIGDSIQEMDYNSTRFVVISKKKIYQEDSKKISICIELPHQSGSLYHILSHFIYNDLNLTGIESRPIEDKPWQYRFFVDVEGNLSSPGVKNALKGLASEAKEMILLGNFK